ncbi:3-beta hydroxysteroid dehydrogenase [Rhodococcus sp. 15-725-2-2b]|uniref:SDR family oxidoreductase n=1 Tax=unclassified Rhodococcus (in: high G+C Gram-positive bacteria) TaxID=192944 RepID=UPI000B9BAA2D|nr:MULTISPECIES: SDR family oxidoreductase [unclassified Rhodococcus (in: high G+C Gram-positive bacteria)]OZC71693.1 3-beta hydroxysteroid dehydrogenase [Rhodococcus sp. 06-469-3-2]OZD42482.1 3-beta hydroxysteroid dehydrogenase [Rhodococcus sp. 06-1477-1A]OZE05940.1 3-beta hydroxysteroid dehydrogenase [Rhodococcus sp. 05-2255-3B1]OZE09149.1 3-beta hydroxysteroid dehydrogenase [Rhodococcus sp. 05-2255-3C]OZE18093.1 3-beta hydroxysteroid dehydrogenase [Rhodococcus sp. 05-2255-2A2]
MKLAVAGGTGTVGVHVVEVARERGHEVVVLSRSAGVDLVSGSGLPDALSGVDAVIDVASTQTISAKESTAFFAAVTRNLLTAEGAAGVRHHVALSIVGIDKAPYAYYAGKVEQERLVRAGAVPWTILRATQFHEFAAQIRSQTSFGPLTVVPRMVSQPIAAREVAERLIDLAERPPAGRVADLGGPREERMAKMVRRYARAIGARGPVLEVPLPGAYGRAMRDGTLVTTQDSDHGLQTFDQWSDAQAR